MAKSGLAPAYATRPSSSALRFGLWLRVEREVVLLLGLLRSVLAFLVGGGGGAAAIMVIVIVICGRGSEAIFGGGGIGIKKMVKRPPAQ